MKRYAVEIILTYWVEMPDDLHTAVVEDIKRNGPVIGNFETENQLAEHIAWNLGLRRFSYVEGLTTEQHQSVTCTVKDEEINESWEESIVWTRSGK